MIDSELINWLSKKLGIVNRPLIEKDLYLQGLLLELEKSSFFKENFLFKGGTCLTKAYYGYYRFSEDLDFTWANQKIFQGKTEKRIRKIISQDINSVMDLLVHASKKLELDFKPEKANRHYIELGGSNRFATFKFWYKPIDSNHETFIKIQVNFVEKILHKPVLRSLKAIANEHKKALELLFPDQASACTQNPSFNCYDLKEIACEKLRALLTRRGFKARDLIDLYWLDKHGIKIKTVRLVAIEKTVFMLKYLKYAENLQQKKFDSTFDLGAEEALLIEKPGKDFEKFMQTALKELNELADETREVAKHPKNLKEDLEFARRTKKAYKRYEKGEFTKKILIKSSKN